MSPASDSQTASVNPFAQQAVQDAHDDLVDVGSLYESSRTALSRGYARARLGRTHLSVVLGDVGSGKSHLLWWLRRRQLSDGLYVPVGALPDLGQPFRYTLRQLLTTLCKRDSSGDKATEKAALERPIDRLLWELLFRQASDLLDAGRIGMYQAPAALMKLVGPLCQEGGRPRPLTEFVAAATPVWGQVEPGLRAYLLSLPTENSLDSAARAVILQYPHADRRALVTAWLAGEDLGPKDREKIGAKQSINNEAAARYVLCALSRLASHALAGPLVLAYDHMDVTGEQLGQPGLQGQAEVIAALQTTGGAVLQVVSCRPQTWTLLHEKPVRPSPAQQQAPALLKNVDDLLKLERPELASLRELVVARLAQIPSATRETLALSDRDLDPASWPAEVGTPRAALAYYAKRIQPQTAPPTPAAPVASTVTPASAVTPVAVPKSAPPKATAPKPAVKAAAAPIVVPAQVAVKAPAVKATAPVAAPAKAVRKQNEDATLSVSAEMIAALTLQSEDPQPQPPPPARKPTEEATLAVPASVMAALAKEFMPDGKPVFDSKPDDDSKAKSSPAPASSKAAAPAKPAVSAKDAPSKPGVSAKAATTIPPAKPSRDADSKPGAASPAAKPTAAKEPSAPASERAAALTPPPAKPKAAADSGMAPLAPSAQSPSVTWMAMADDDNPLTKAIAEAEAELKPAKAKPAPSKPVAAAVPAKKAVPVVSVNQAALSKPLPAASPVRSDSDGDATMMAPMSPPSSQSPSVTWMAMAGGEDVLSAAIAEAEADLGISKPKAATAKPAAKPAAAAPAKPAAKPTASAPAGATPLKASAAPSSQSPSMAWMNMGGDNPLLSGSSDKLAPVGGRGRNTQEKMPPVAARPSAGLSPEQVLSALGNRSTVEEAQLAKELNVAVGALAAPLARLEDRGAVRVAAVAGGKRVISKL